MRRAWFFDMDGFMFDFERAYRELFGTECRDVPDDAMWEKIHSHPTFFRDLHPCPGALEFFAETKRLDPIMLTACPQQNYATIARQKIASAREHLSKSIWVLPVRGGHNKPLFMRAPGDVLIDDHARNCAAWEEAGGIAILHSNDDFNRTRMRMAEIIDQAQYKTTDEFSVAMRFPRFGVADV